MARKNRDEYNAYMAEYMLRRYHRRMEAARSELGGKCVVCGNIDALELDHIDPNTKWETVTKIYSYSEKRFKEELKKCQLLCEDCHKAKHKSQYPCGTPQKYWRGCKCIACKTANTIYSKEYKQGRQ